MSANSTYYPDSKEKAGEYLRIVLAMMAQHGNAATPVNYAVWYEYVSGKNNQLRTLMDNAMEQSVPLTGVLLQKLYARYVDGGERLASMAVLPALKRVIETVSTQIEETGGTVSKSEVSLQKCAGLIQDEIEVDSLRRIAKVILKETRGVIDTGENLEAGFAEARKEIESLRLKLDQSRAEAHTDALTGLINRRGLEKVLLAKMKDAREAKSEMCIAMADIDHFKRINDNYGHLMGDNVLRMFANTLTDFVKGRDKVVRYGGEEFLVVFPETSLENATTLTEKIRACLEKMQWKRKCSGEAIGVITLSMGIARYRYDESIESLVQRADRALYFSKENGRNRVSTELHLQ